MEAGLSELVHPGRFPGMSPKMASIVAYVLGEYWTEPETVSLSVTSDGHVVSDAHFMGSGEDLDRNIADLLDAAELSEQLRTEWASLYRAKVDDWRYLKRGDPNARKTYRNQGEEISQVRLLPKRRSV